MDRSPIWLLLIAVSRHLPTQTIPHRVDIGPYEQPPPPTRIHEGAACVFPFSRERGVFFGSSLGKIIRESPEKGIFFGWYLPIVNNTRDRGVQVMGNEHRYPLVLWEWGGGGVVLDSSAPSGELSWWGVVVEIVVMVGNSWALFLYFCPVGNCPLSGVVLESFFSLCIQKLNARLFLLLLLPFVSRCTNIISTIKGDLRTICRFSYMKVYKLFTLGTKFKTLLSLGRKITMFSKFITNYIEQG